MTSKPKRVTADDAVAFTVEDAARVSACSRSSLFAAINEGRLKARKNGRRTLILDTDLRRWLAKLPVREIA